MLKNYIVTAFRNIQKSKSYSFINIMGLAVSIACTILILLWVQYELSYDNFHQNADRIYRITSVLNRDSATWASTPGPLALAIREEMPEIKLATRFRSSADIVFRHNDEVIIEDGHAITDPSFFAMFSVTFLSGKAESALAAPNNIVLTESFARKYFGDINPINQLIETDSSLLTVSAVIKNLPQNSQFQFKYLTPFYKAEKHSPILQSWGRYPTYTYIQLTEKAQPEAVSQAIRSLILRHQPNHSERMYELQPLQSIHFTTDLFNDDSITMSRNYIYIFLAIAIFIVLIACINYMSLSTARHTNRAKEIGIKKAIGATRRNIIFQFMAESLFMTTFAFICALLLVAIARPYFNGIAGVAISMQYKNPRFIVSMLLLLFLIGLLAGSYPALYLSSIQPCSIFRKSIQGWAKRFNFRHVLTIIQFSLSIALIIGMLVVNQQVHFLHTKNLGFNKENILCLQLRRSTETNYKSMQHELAQYPDIMGVAVKNCSPDRIYRATQANWAGKDPDKRAIWEVSWIDATYFPDLEVEFLHGRNFSDEFPSDITDAVIINEAGSREMRLANPVGSQIELYRQNRTIVGVIKDANFHSLHKVVEPQIYMPVTEDQITSIGCTFLIRTGPDVAETIKAIEQTWQKHVKDQPINYSFLDEHYERLYTLEQRIQLLFNVFTIFAIFISCLGLIGLGSFMAEKRTKEIGVRKVLGASIPNVISLLVSDFAKLILLANFVAWPMAFFTMEKWLHNFAYRIHLTVWPFLLAGISALVIAMITVSWQAIRAAIANPVKSLKHE